MYKDIDIYNIGYITILKIGDCENSVNSLCLIIDTELKMKLKQETVVNMVKILWKLKFTTDDNLSLNKALNLHCEQ